MKLENILLDHSGHCRLSDMGLAVVTKVKIRGYAGTPGYTAPEMIKSKQYGNSADIFSYGVMLYRMLCGAKPFKGKSEQELDKAVELKKPVFMKEIFSAEAVRLLNGLLQKRPEHRLGCAERGIDEIKEHKFFENIDWGLLEAGYIDPPFGPNKFDVNAASLKDIGDFDKNRYKHVQLDPRFRERVKNFGYVSLVALQEEMVAVLEKADENTNFEKFGTPNAGNKSKQDENCGNCCVIL
jgi:serine/threonine protein kinase